MRKLFVPLLRRRPRVMFAVRAVRDRAARRYESTMGLVQKIFYFHVPSWMAMFTAIGRLRRRQRAFTCSRAAAAADRIAVPAAELAVLFGLIGPRHRAAVGAQGVGRLVAVGRAAHHRRCCSS